MKSRILAAGYTVAGVANTAGTPPAHLYNILNGVRRPRPELALALEAATGGIITAAELLGILPVSPKGALSEAPAPVVTGEQGGDAAPALPPLNLDAEKHTQGVASAKRVA